MRKRLRRALPSMFHRRLLLLMVLFAVPVFAMGAQLYRLTVLQGDRLRDEAERRMVASTWTPTSRGRILDRQGRVLAVDRPSYEAAVDFSVITGSWAEAQAGRLARRVAGDRWATLAPAERADLIDRFAPAYRQHVEAMWAALAETTGVSPDDLLDRRERVLSEVDRMYASIVGRRRAQLEAQLVRGRELTTEAAEDLEARIERQAAPCRCCRGSRCRAPARGCTRSRPSSWTSTSRRSPSR